MGVYAKIEKHSAVKFGLQEISPSDGKEKHKWVLSNYNP